MHFPHLQLNPAQFDEMLDSYELRREFVRRYGMLGFGIIYLPHYFYLPPADFHQEMIAALEDPTKDLVLIKGFRGSAKSVNGSVLLPIYAAVEKPKDYPFILPIADTGQQSSINIANIKQEFEYNELLLQDYGRFDISGTTDQTLEDPTLESDEEWQARNMLLSNGVRILARSRGQKVRGLRHREFRPRMVIGDDLEDLEWVQKKENRDKTERWMTGEVMPAMDEKHRKLVVIGNELNTDGLLARLEKKKRFLCLAYPLIKDGPGTELERCTWKAKYPTQKSIDDKKLEMGPVAWQREMLLKVVPEEGAEIKPEDIHYYDAFPAAPSLVGTGLDYAISKSERADYTAGVSGSLTYEESGRPHIDIHSDPLNARLDMQETVAHVLALQQVFGGNHIVYGEEVAYQKAANDELERNGIAVERMRAIKDKRARLRVAAVYIKNGTVRFPRTGCEDLLMQLLGFGIEEHDDLVDALAYLILGLVNQGLKLEEVVAI